MGTENADGRGAGRRDDRRVPGGGRPLPSALRALAERLPDRSALLLCTDFDGTLAPIVDEPDAAEIRAEIRELLRELAADDRVTVAVISGRELTDVAERVGVDGITYAGNHGLEQLRDGERTVHPRAEEYAEDVDRVCGTFDGEFAVENGLLVENKGLSATLHLQETPPDRREALRETVDTVVEWLSDGRLRTESAKDAVEIHPEIEWDKGERIAALLEERDDEPLPVFLGDDRTDESGFRTVEARGGVSVYVGTDGETVAAESVADPAAVEAFFRWLATTGTAKLGAETAGDPDDRIA
ncbi:trehalose-phosphatase [Halegenticoccus tardaugens]|uniref:trehalose-phosphatase n=1 Tax=Halegenticoccus tardaugens TaxID=2071624 RepID=UPI00100BDA13|nr:trehalose-phosphatase [Halegenticoccus tardaugens]